MQEGKTSYVLFQFWVKSSVLWIDKEPVEWQKLVKKGGIGVLLNIRLFT